MLLATHSVSRVCLEQRIFFAPCRRHGDLQRTKRHSHWQPFCRSAAGQPMLMEHKGVTPSRQGMGGAGQQHDAVTAVSPNEGSCRLPQTLHTS